MATEGFLSSLYTNKLGRDADTPGMDYWMGTDYSDDRLEEIFSASDEAKAYAATQKTDPAPFLPPPPVPTPTPTLATETPAENATETPATTTATTTPTATTTATPTLAEVQPYVPQGNDLVENRMTGLLASDNPYMENARKSGELLANTRGLLNSSLSGEASQKAAIEAALPIAQQDAQALTTAGTESSLVDQKAYASSLLSAQDASQALTLDQQQQDGANARQAAELAMNEKISLAELGSQQRIAMADSMTTLGDNFQAKLAGIQVDDSFPNTEAKTEAIADVQATYQANLDSLASIYGVAEGITWVGVDFGSRVEADKAQTEIDAADAAAETQATIDELSTQGGNR